MASLNGFDASSVEPDSGFVPIPPDRYVAIVTSTEMRPIRNGSGEFLLVELQILEGPCKGRRVWDRLTLKHQNSQTVEIARSQLSALCRAVGVLKPADSSQLHDIPLQITVAIRERSDTGEPANVVRRYAAIERTAPPAPPAPAPRAPARNGQKAPWER